MFVEPRPREVVKVNATGVDEIWIRLQRFLRTGQPVVNGLNRRQRTDFIFASGAHQHRRHDDDRATGDARYAEARRDRSGNLASRGNFHGRLA